MTDDDEKHKCINNVKQHFNISQCQSIKKNNMNHHNDTK